MPASALTNKFSPINFGLSLLGAIVLSLPQSVPAKAEGVISRDRTIPTSALPESVATLVLTNATQNSGLPVSNLRITSVREVTWPDGCMGRKQPNTFCTMALVDGWIVTVESGQQKWVYHTNGSRVVQPNEPTPKPIGDRLSPSVMSPISIREPGWWWVDRCRTAFGSRCEPWNPRIPGASQQNPIMPTVTRPNMWEFIGGRRGDWYDPPTAYGFRYEMTSDSVFTEIIDFPTGFAKPFTVLVKDVILGEFTAGNSVNFSNYSQLLGNLLLGSGVKEFSVTGLNVDPTNPAAFPLQLDFNTETANFNMHALLNEAEAVPEPSMMLGLFASGSFLVGVVRKRKQRLSR
ncbi:MAG: PEP-CTERM sorting domain-containing protein [Microcoleus sp.]